MHGPENGQRIVQDVVNHDGINHVLFYVGFSGKYACGCSCHVNGVSAGKDSEMLLNQTSS